MMRVNIQIEGAMVSQAVAALDIPRADVLSAAAQAVEAEVQAHLLGINSRSPNTNYYSRASRDTEVTATDAEGIVRIRQRGMALRYYGGTVKAGATISSQTGRATKFLAIPTDAVPLRTGGDARKPPREMGLLAYLPSKKGGAVLVEGTLKQIIRGPRKGQQRVVPKADGKLLYILKKETTHAADPTVIPDDETMLAAATRAVGDLLELATDNPTA